MTWGEKNRRQEKGFETGGASRTALARCDLGTRSGRKCNDQDRQTKRNQRMKEGLWHEDERSTGENESTGRPLHKQERTAQIGVYMPLD
jgi:hypothetical protein